MLPFFVHGTYRHWFTSQIKVCRLWTTRCQTQNHVTYTLAKVKHYQPVVFRNYGNKGNILPASPPPNDKDLEILHHFVLNSQRLVVLTGAGASTECGIPDYRSPNGAYSSGFKPVTHQEFLKSAKSRKRYWARSYAGWKRFVAAKPGPTHLTLARLEARGHIKGIITQNVDRLHHRAGSKPLELHGTTHAVICLDCGDLTSRWDFQDRVKTANPHWAKVVEAFENGEAGSDVSFGMQQRPDGDIEIDEKFWEENFEVPACEQCCGILKPDVVFFGDNIPRDRADQAMSIVTGADALLVVGSSLMTLSAFRLARAACANGAPIVIINIGPTRADKLAIFKIESRSGEVLSRLLAMGALDIPTTGFFDKKL